MTLLRVKGAGAGINTDLLPSELAPEAWSSGYNMRPRNGFMARRDGFRQIYSTPTVTPYFQDTYITATTRYMVAAGIAKVHAHEGSTETEITRYTDGVTIASITFSGTTATLNTSTPHGRTTGQDVTVFGALDGSSLSANYNGTFTITVTDTDTFTYTMPGTPSNNATVNSATGYSYDVQADFTGTIDDKWTGGSFNGVFVLNNPVDGPYYWAGDTTKRLRRLPGWPAGQKCDAMLFFKNFILALAPTVDGVKNNQLILWGTSAEPGALPASWTAASTNDAGDNPLPAETGGPLIDGKTFGDTAYLFDSDACYAMQYIGGNDVFRPYRLAGVDGVLARHCVVATPKGLVYLSNGDVKLLDGVTAISLAEGKVRDRLNSAIANNAQRCFLAVNPSYNEVWVCYPSAEDDTCTTAAVWNWDTGAWGFFTIPELTCACTGLLIDGLIDDTIDSSDEIIDSVFRTIDESSLSAQQMRLVVGKSGAIGLADSGSSDFGTAISWELERRGITFDDLDRLKMISKSRWAFDALTGTTISIYHGASALPDQEPTYADAVTYTHGTTNYVNRFSPKGRHLAVKIAGSGSDPVSIRTYELDVVGGGRH